MYAGSTLDFSSTAITNKEVIQNLENIGLNGLIGGTLNISGMKATDYLLKYDIGSTTFAKYFPDVFQEVISTVPSTIQENEKNKSNEKK